MINEPTLIITIQTATILLFVIAYNIFNPVIKFAEESEYSDIFKKYRKTGRAMVKRYYFNELFLQVIIIGNDHIKKYYYVKKRNGIYKKLFQKFKMLNNEAKIFKNKTEQKSSK